MNITIQEVAYHRNGISGAPFYAIRFLYDNRAFLATVFEEKAHVAVICLDLIAEHGVKFGINSWRGDQYERELRGAIAEYEMTRDAARGDA